VHTTTTTSTTTTTTTANTPRNTTPTAAATHTTYTATTPTTTTTTTTTAPPPRHPEGPTGGSFTPLLIHVHHHAVHDHQHLPTHDDHGRIDAHNHLGLQPHRRWSAVNMRAWRAIQGVCLGPEVLRPAGGGAAVVRHGFFKNRAEGDAILTKVAAGIGFRLSSLAACLGGCLHQGVGSSWFLRGSGLQQLHIGVVLVRAKQDILGVGSLALDLRQGGGVRIWRDDGLLPAPSAGTHGLHYWYSRHRRITGQEELLLRGLPLSSMESMTGFGLDVIMMS